MEYIDIFGYVAGILVVISLLPQLIKVWKTKLVRDLSYWRYIIYSIGLILWIIYAILIKNGPVGMMNTAGLIIALLILFFKIKYRNNS